jgi:flagellin-specific chaperone FliS
MRQEKTPQKPTRRDVSRADPIALISMAYDLAVLACLRRDALNSSKAVGMLRDAMQFAGPEDSKDLLKFYDWCLDRIREEEFELAGEVLKELRDSWQEIERRFSGGSGQMDGPQENTRP